MVVAGSLRARHTDGEMPDLPGNKILVYKYYKYNKNFP